MSLSDLDSAPGAAAPAPLVRPAVAGDLAQIHAIYSHHVLHSLGTFDIDPPNQAAMAEKLAHIQTLGLPFMVAAGADGVLLGYAYAGPFRPRAAYRFTVEDSVYIAPGAARRGVGRSLLGEVIRLSAAAGMTQMIAVIGDSGNAGSIGLHRALGFREAGRLSDVGFKHGRRVDVVMMQRALETD